MVMKKGLRLQDLQKSLTFEVKRQEEAICSKATLDTEACGNLTTYLQNVAFQQCRMGYLYGRFADDNSAKVAAIYEPPQEVSPEDCITLDDPQESSVRLVQDLLGLQRVGWVFTHPPGREEGFRFTGKELLRAAELQLQGGEESPFVTVKVTATEDGHSEFDAFQISKQGLEMCQNGVLDIHPSDAKKVAPDPKFSIIVEKSEVKEVDTDFFLTVVPIAQYNSGLSSSFPKASREGREITKVRELMKSMGSVQLFAFHIAFIGALCYRTTLLIFSENKKQTGRTSYRHWLISTVWCSWHLKNISAVLFPPCVKQF